MVKPMDRITRTLTFGPLLDGTTRKTTVTFRRVIPGVPAPRVDPLSYDFSATIAAGLGLPREEWRLANLGLSRRVPNEVLHEFYPSALLYQAIVSAKMPNAFAGLTAERLFVKSAAEMVELFVKYRYYLGLARPDGEYKLISSKGQDLQLIGIQDAYDRLFSLANVETAKRIREYYGPIGVTLMGTRDVKLYSANGKLIPGTLSFSSCLRDLIPEEKNPYRQFLESAYGNVRIPEYHSCRIGDNIHLQVEEFLVGLVRTCNYLFDSPLKMPWRPKDREPFFLRLLRLANARILPNGKMRTGYEDILARGDLQREFF